MLELSQFTSLSVLVVDDEESVRDMLGWILNDAGYVTHSVPGGHEALAFMRARHQVDLVLSDINMPDMDGIALCRAIEIEFPAVPVLLISGRPRPDGIKAFVAKPFRAQVLTREIEQLTLASRTVQVGKLQHAYQLLLHRSVRRPQPPAEYAPHRDVAKCPPKIMLSLENQL